MKNTECIKTAQKILNRMCQPVNQSQSAHSTFAPSLWLCFSVSFTYGTDIDVWHSILMMENPFFHIWCCSRRLRCCGSRSLRRWRCRCRHVNIAISSLWSIKNTMFVKTERITTQDESEKKNLEFFSWNMEKDTAEYTIHVHFNASLLPPLQFK